MLQKVEDHENLRRDTNSKAIINTDNSSFAIHQKKRTETRQQRERINRLEKEVSGINEKLELILSKLDKISG
jgi:predicted nuclease with TOPRIM domain